MAAAATSSLTGTPATGAGPFSQEECVSIAQEYDGRTQTIDRLLEAWSLRKPNLKRHHIYKAAVRGGYAPSADRKAWNDPAEDQFLIDNWHKLSGDEIAARLGRTFNSVNLRRKRLEIGRYDGTEFTIRDLEELTKIDHRQWHDFAARGWLKVRSRARRRGAAPITYVSVHALHKLFRSHPEIYDYGSAIGRSRVALDLGRLPPAPAWKRVVCLSDAWTDRVKRMPVGRTMSHGKAIVVERLHRFELDSCKAAGGTGFWTSIYATPQCPRCGCQVSRYSDGAIFTELDPGNDEVIDIQARKLGLRWIDGKVHDSEGRVVDDHDVLSCLFDSGKRNGTGLRAFEKLVDAGLSVVKTVPVARADLLDNILSIKLRPDQEDVFQTFVATGALTAAQAMSFGKSTLGLMAMTRLGGRHLLVVDTAINREQWIEKMRATAPRVVVEALTKPLRMEVTVFDREGGVRSVIDIFSYATRSRLDGEWVVGCYDEVHRLPAKLAHRHAYAKTRYRIGMSATADLRCDGRGALVSKMTGALVGDDWRDQMANGLVKRVPVKVLIVEDVEHKHEVVGDLLRAHKSVVVMCESLDDGAELELRYGIPFVHGRTKDKLAVVRASRSVVLSRVGDAGISIPTCEVTVDHSGLFGSRIQSLQRLGRLMHSDRGLYHCILMTHEERYERFAKRIEAITKKGFEVTEELAPRAAKAHVHDLRSPALKQRVSAAENPFLSLLGWRSEDLHHAA